MINDEFAAIIDELDDLLEVERSALLKGDLAQIGALVDRKEALIDQLSQLDSAEADRLEALNTKVRRNQGLLDGALEGIRAVTKRLSELRRVQRSLDTYDEHGQRKTIDIREDGSVEKRA